MEQQLTV